MLVVVMGCKKSWILDVFKVELAGCFDQFNMMFC